MTHRPESARLLEGKRCVVVGAASGIGAAAVRAFLAAGAHVTALDLHEPDRTEATQARVPFFSCDAAIRDSVFAAFEASIDQLGGLDVMANFAGISERCAAEDISDAAWDRMLDVNARGTMLTNQAAFRYMRDHGGRIINTGSGVAIQGQAASGVEAVGLAHYAAAKAAIMAWTRGIAREWARYGITANSLVSAAWTPMYERSRERMSQAQRDSHDAFMNVAIPLGGALGDPDDDLAPVLVFLASDLARFVTGQVVAVNGGLLMLG